MTDSAGEQAKQASLQDLYEGARRDATYWNERWHASHFEHAAERERLEARLAASEAEVAVLKAKLIDDGHCAVCLGFDEACGKSECPQREKRLRRECHSLRAKLAKADALAQACEDSGFEHDLLADKHVITVALREYFQSSEKG